MKLEHPELHMIYSFIGEGHRQHFVRNSDVYC